jgi:cell division protein FtsN
LALRKPGSSALTTSYTVATMTAPRPAAAPAPVRRPVVHVASGKSLTLAPAKAAPVRRAVAPVAAPVALAPAPAATGAEATTIKNRTGRYYLIVAAYGSLARAEEGRRNLAHAGRPAKVILPPRGSRLYRLSAIDFADKPTATLAANRLRQNPHFDKGLTILSY